MTKTKIRSVLPHFYDIFKWNYYLIIFLIMKFNIWYYKFVRITCLPSIVLQWCLFLRNKIFITKNFIKIRLPNLLWFNTLLRPLSHGSAVQLIVVSLKVETIPLWVSQVIFSNRIECIRLEFVCMYVIYSLHIMQT